MVAHATRLGKSNLYPPPPHPLITGRPPRNEVNEHEGKVYYYYYYYYYCYYYYYYVVFINHFRLFCQFVRCCVQCFKGRPAVACLLRRIAVLYIP